MSALYMPPCLPSDNVLHGGLIDKEHFGEPSAPDSILVEFAHFYNLSICKFCSVAPFSRRASVFSPSFRNHVENIFVIGRRKQMRGAKAIPNIAPVGGLCPIGELPLEELKRSPVNVGALALVRCSSIPSSSYAPIPKQTWILAPWGGKIIPLSFLQAINQIVKVGRLVAGHIRVLPGRDCSAPTLFAQCGAISIVSQEAC